MSDSSIDAEIGAFIEKTGAFYGDTRLDDVEAQRRCYNEMCAFFNVPYPEGVKSEDYTIDSHGHALKLREYWTDDIDATKAVVYYHGGGYILGDLESHDSICAEICHHTGYAVVSVDYRLAPEHHFPEDLEDAVAAFLHTARRYSKVVVMGDSAGGNLAAAVCIATRDDTEKPAGQVLIYPGLGGELSELESYTNNADVPMLTAKEHEYYIAVRSNHPDDIHDPLFLPLNLLDYSGLPPCAAFSADVDPIRDDAGEWVRRLTDAGVTANWTNEPMLPHGYLRARHHSRRAADSFSRICEAIRSLGD